MLKAHDSKIRKRLNKYCLFGSFARRKAILSKENMAAELVKFVSFNLNKTQDFWKFEQMRSGLAMFDRNAQRHLWRKPNTGHLILTVKHGGRGVVI